MYENNREQLDSLSDAGGWFNYWHAHDWLYDQDTEQYSDFSAHLDEIALLFRAVLDARQRLNIDSQAWISLDPAEPLQDAVYLHSPNPHTDFPEPFDDVEWDCDVPERYRKLVTGRRCGIRKFEGDEVYVVLEA